ncbi:MAG: formyl transferase [Pseudomonadales bacterium]|nr:formyl transferase [Pseudomonadales bacterium]
MSALKILILCGRSPRHLYVANKLCESADVLAIVQETGSDLNWASLKKKLKPANLLRKANRWIRDRKRYTGNGEASFFFDQATPKLNYPNLVKEVPHINHPDVVKLADELQPDVIAVFGTSLIKGELLTKGRLGIINLHGGLSPHYRGADCTFWALYNEEPEQIGCTLHYINAGIDTGDLICHISPEVKPEDDELTLFWRGIKTSADCYAELITRMSNSEKFGQNQSVKGKLYQVKDREHSHEKHLNNLLTRGMLKDINLQTRVQWFSKKAQQKKTP